MNLMEISIRTILYRQEKWNDCVPYLEFAAENTNDKRTKRICNVMVVGAMVKSENGQVYLGLYHSFTELKLNMI